MRSHCMEIKNEFKEIIKNYNIVLITDEYGCKDSAIFAKDIPFITEKLTNLGWKKEYIPFGP